MFLSCSQSLTHPRLEVETKQKPCIILTLSWKIRYSSFFISKLVGMWVGSNKIIFNSLQWAMPSFFEHFQCRYNTLNITRRGSKWNLAWILLDPSGQRSVPGLLSIKKKSKTPEKKIYLFEHCLVCRWCQWCHLPMRSEVSVGAPQAHLHNLR